MNQWTKELMHHGIQGMHWGERNGPPYPLDSTVSSNVRKGKETVNTALTPEQKLAIKNLKGAKTANLDKFGKTPETNTLYIAGYSGSGKSTTALGIKRKNDHVIHLDAYSEPDSGGAVHLRSKTFNKFLDKKCPRWREMANAKEDVSDENIIKYDELKRFGGRYFKVVDQFRDAIEDFSKQEFKKGNRVIVEGVQLADDWLSADKSYYEGKPVIALQTKALTSMKRAFERDDRGNLIKGLKNLDDAKDYIRWYSKSSKNIKDLVSKSGTIEKGKKYINDLVGVST